MRKIKLNYEQAMEVLAMHLESLGAIRSDEHIDILPIQVLKGCITIYVNGKRPEV